MDPSSSHRPLERRNKSNKKTTPKQTSKENPTLDYDHSWSSQTALALIPLFTPFNYPSVKAPGEMSSTTGFPLSGNSNCQVGPSIQPSALPNWQINTAAFPNNATAMLSQQFGRVHSLPPLSINKPKTTSYSLSSFCYVSAKLRNPLPGFIRTT